MCLEHNLGLHVLTSMHVRASCVIGLGVHMYVAMDYVYVSIHVFVFQIFLFKIKRRLFFCKINTSRLFKCFILAGFPVCVKTNLE